MREIKTEVDENKDKLKNTIVIGFLLRIFALWFILTWGLKFSEPYFISDDIAYEEVAKTYLQLAERLVDMDVINMIIKGYMQPFWPIVMCITSYMFKNIYAARVLNVILSTASIWIVYKITEEISESSKSALSTARLFAFLPVNVLICCFQIKDIFLTVGVLYAFYIFLLLKNSRKVKLHQTIICIALLVGVYYTRGGVVEMLVIFLLVYVLLKYIRKKEYGKVLFCVIAFSVIAFLIKDMIIGAFETKINDYGGVTGEEGGIANVQINSITQIYRLPFTVFFANLQPLTLDLFSKGENSRLWLRVICHLNISMYPIAFGNVTYIFLKKKDMFFWLSTFIMYSAVIILSTGVFRHYLFLLPVQLINYSVCVEEKPYLKQFFYIASGALLLLVAFMSMRS